MQHRSIIQSEMFNTLISFYIHLSIDEEVLMQHDIGTLDRNLATIKS